MTRSKKHPNSKDAYFRLFNYNPNSWKNKMMVASTEDEKMDVAGRFAFEALHAFMKGSDEFKEYPDQQTKLMKHLANHARWIANHSGGVQEGFKLTSGWFKILLTQMVLHGAEEDGKTDEMKGKITMLWKHYGWENDLEDCFDPKWDRIRSTLPVKYAASDDQINQFNLILEPTGEFPIQSLWRAKMAQNGK